MLRERIVEAIEFFSPPLTQDAIWIMQTFAAICFLIALCLVFQEE